MKVFIYCCFDLCTPPKSLHNFCGGLENSQFVLTNLTLVSGRLLFGLVVNFIFIVWTGFHPNCFHLNDMKMFLKYEIYCFWQTIVWTSFNILLFYTLFGLVFIYILFVADYCLDYFHLNDIQMF